MSHRKDSDLDSSATNSEVENIMRTALVEAEDSATSEEESFLEEEITFFCDHCDFKTKTDKGIKVNIGRVHSIKCKTCDEKFTSKER